MKIWSLPKHENLTTGKNILWKRGEIALKEQFLLFFHNIFSIHCISNFKSPVTNIFVKCGCSKYIFLNSANLICRGTDISKYFIESLGFRDNESRLYFMFSVFSRAAFTDFIYIQTHVCARMEMFKKTNAEHISCIR